MPTEKTLAEATLCLLVRDSEVLLAMKVKEEKIGTGCWNGYGGGPDSPKESLVDCAIRELKEESGGVVVLPKDLVKMAIIDFHNTRSNGNQFTCRVYVYLASCWQGEPKSTEEMADPTWFPIQELPPAMMPADRVWLPVVLAGHKILGEAHYGPFQKELLRPVWYKAIDSLG